MTDVELRLQADLTDAQRNVASFRKEYVALVREVEKPLRQIDSFRALESALENTERSAQGARDKVRDLGNQMAASAAPSKALQQSYRDSVSELQRLDRQQAQQVVQLAAMRAEMSAAGIDTRNLAQQQARLRKEYAQRVQTGALASATAASRKNLGLDSYQALRKEIAGLTADYQRLTREGNLSASERAVAEQAYRSQIEKTTAALKRMRGEQEGGSGSAGLAAAAGGALSTTAVVGVAIAAAAAAAAKAADSYGKMTDPLKQMDSQLRNATGSQAEFNRAQAELLRIAEETQSPLTSVVALYSRMSPALREAGRSQTETLGVIEAVGLTLKISGASAEESAGAILQFSQALGSGALRGDEFNSVAEQSPRLLRALAEGMQVPTGALRDLAAQGNLTADVIVDALMKQLPQLRQEAEGFGGTYSGAMQNLSTASQQAVKRFDELTGASKSLVSVINAIADAAKKMNAGNGLSLDFKLDPKAAARAEVLVREIALVKGRLESIPDAAATGQKALLVQLEAELKAILEAQRAAAKESGEISSQTTDEARANQEKYLRQLAQHRNSLKGVRDQLLVDAKASISEQEKLEQAQLDKIEDLRKERLAIEKKYQATIKQLNGTVQDTTPSYSNAEDLKVSAKQALATGDFETALKQAEAARQMLLEMQKAGQSTYGLSGFAKELEGIEIAANGLQKTQADAKLDAISQKLIDMKAAAASLEKLQITPTLSDEAASSLIEKMKALARQVGDEVTVSVGLKPVTATEAMQTMSLQNNSLVNLPGASSTLDVPVKPQLDDAAANQAATQVQALSQRLAKSLTVPLTISVQDATDTTSAPGYASGGHIRGPGSGTSDSILARLSNGEFVVRAAAVQHYGPELLHALNAKRLPAFATGGEVGFVPDIPPITQAVLGTATGTSGRPVNLTIPGLGDVPLRGDQSVVEGLERHLKMLAIQKGSNKRRGKTG